MTKPVEKAVVQPTEKIYVVYEVYAYSDDKKNIVAFCKDADTATALMKKLKRQNSDYAYSKRGIVANKYSESILDKVLDDTYLECYLEDRI